MKYLKLFSCNAVRPSALFSIMHFKLQNAKSLFIELREELSQQISKFTKVSSQQSFFTLSMFIVSKPNLTQNLFFLSILLVSKAPQ